MLKKFLKAGFGGAGAQVINFVALSVIARLYLPEDFAAWALVMAVAGIIGGVSCFRYELAIVIPGDDEKAAALFWFCLLSSAVMALVTSIFFYSILLMGILPNNGVILPSCYTIFTPLMVFATGCSLALRYWHIRLGNFSLNSFSMLGMALVALVFQVVYVFVFARSYLGLIIGSFAGQSAVVLMLSLGLLRCSLPAFNSTVARMLTGICCEYRNFILYSTPYTLFGMLRSRAPIFVMEIFLTSREVGLYAFAFRIMNFPLGLVGGALRPVIFQAAAIGGVKAIGSQINRILIVMAWIITPVVVLYFFYAEDLFRLFFGENWADAGHIGKFIIVPVFVFLFCGWMDRIFDLLNHQRLVMLMEMLFGVASIAALWLGLELGFGIHGALFLQSIILTGYGITYLNLAYDRANYNREILIKVVWRVFFAASAAWALLTFIENIV